MPLRRRDTRWTVVETCGAGRRGGHEGGVGVGEGPVDLRLVVFIDYTYLLLSLSFSHILAHTLALSLSPLLFHSIPPHVATFTPGES